MSNARPRERFTYLTQAGFGRWVNPLTEVKDVQAGEQYTAVVVHGRKRTPATITINPGRESITLTTYDKDTGELQRAVRTIGEETSDLRVRFSRRGLLPATRRIETFEYEREPISDEPYGPSYY